MRGPRRPSGPAGRGPGGWGLSYGHDASGRPASRANGLGRRIGFTHNALGQVIRKEVEGNGVTTFEYDVFDELAMATGPDAVLERLRDRHGRLRSEKVNGRTLTYAYDVTSGSRRLQHRAYGYGPGGGLVGISDALSGTRGFDVDPAGRVTAVHARGWTERYA